MAVDILNGAGDYATAVSASANSLTVNKPTNTADGDLLLCYTLFRNTGGTITAPSGWTVIGVAESTAFTEAVYCKPIPTASAETPTSYTFSTSAGSSRAALICARVTGVDLTTPIQAAGSWITGISGTVTLASLTATGAGLLAVAAARNYTNATAETITWGGSLATDLTAITGTTTTTQTHLGSEAISAAGATGTRTVTMAPQSTTVGQMFILNAAATNAAPTANAGTDQTDIEPRTTVTLDGTGSTDSDGTIAAYAWTQTAGTTVTLSSATAAQPTFTAPLTLAGETLTFSLVVTDDDGATSSADTVNVTVLPASAAVWDGSAWQPRQEVRWNGTAWV